MLAFQNAVLMKSWVFGISTGADCCRATGVDYGDVWKRFDVYLKKRACSIVCSLGMYAD